MSVSKSDLELGHIGEGKVLNVEQEDIKSTNDDEMPEIKKQNYGRSLLKRLTKRSRSPGTVHSNVRIVVASSMKREYDRSLQGLRLISLTSYILGAANFFLVFCALTWATTVVLSTYLKDLDLWNSVAVPILLLLEYINIGLVAFQRTVGYKMPKWLRKIVLLAEIVLPLGMGSFAVWGYLPTDSRKKVREWFRTSNAASSTPSPIASPAKFTPPPPPPGLRYGNQHTVLKIFYVLIILSAGVILVELIIKGVLTIYFLGLSTAKSLHNYHDNMFERSNSWTDSWVDLDFAFKMQSFEYKHGNVTPEKVCGEYTDLVWYLYVREGGFEAAESALGDTDSYVRQAAANMVGFWAVLETFPEVQLEGCRLPLEYQRGLLSKLADVAAQSYGPTGMAAARSIGLLLQGRDPVGVATEVKSESGEGVVAILVKRVNQLRPPPTWERSVLAGLLKEEACTHIHALRELLGQLREVPASVPATGIRASKFTQAQREQIVAEMQQSLLQDSSVFNTCSVDYTIQRLDDLLKGLISSAPHAHAHAHAAAAAAAATKDYFSLFQALLKPQHDKTAHIRSLIKSVVGKLLLYVGSVLVGFSLGSLIDHH